MQLVHAGVTSVPVTSESTLAEEVLANASLDRAKPGECACLGFAPCAAAGALEVLLLPLKSSIVIPFRMPAAEASTGLGLELRLNSRHKDKDALLHTSTDR